MQETLLTTPSQPVEREIGPLPLFGCLLAAALACGLAALLYQQRRRKNMWKIRTGKRPGSQIGTAYVHELGARDSQQDAFVSRDRRRRSAAFWRRWRMEWEGWSTAGR